MNENSKTVNNYGTPGEYVIRESGPAVLFNTRKVAITGTITAPADYVEPKAVELEGPVMFKEQDRYVAAADYSFITYGENEMLLVNYDKKQIQLEINEASEFVRIITGRLEESKEFKTIMVSDMSPRDLAQLIKMNRTFFESKEIAMSLVAQLQNFKAKIDGEMQKIADDRGNYDYRRAQTVESNLPKGFNLTIPLFKGMGKVTFFAEIYIDPASLSCSIVSPDANDIMEESTRRLMDEVVERVKSVMPKIAVIRQ